MSTDAENVRGVKPTPVTTAPGFHLSPGQDGFVAHALECPDCRAKLNTPADQRTPRDGVCTTCGKPCKRGRECRACAINRWHA